MKSKPLLWIIFPAFVFWREIIVAERRLLSILLRPESIKKCKIYLTTRMTVLLSLCLWFGRVQNSQKQYVNLIIAYRSTACTNLYIIVRTEYFFLNDVRFYKFKMRMWKMHLFCHELLARRDTGPYLGETECDYELIISHVRMILNSNEILNYFRRRHIYIL